MKIWILEVAYVYDGQTLVACFKNEPTVEDILKANEESLNGQVNDVENFEQDLVETFYHPTTFQGKINGYFRNFYSHEYDYISIYKETLIEN